MSTPKKPDPKLKPDSASVHVTAPSSEQKPVRKTFPGPRGAQSKLRVAVERSAYADLIVHAKASLEAEVCGILAGQLCEDDEGLFVSVGAAIRGAAAAQGSTHVTFTQETWNIIHQTLERDHPKLKIVGWYHTHPGFGVQFSDMDLFIQRHFFSAPQQLALVTDPLNSATAICVSTAEGIQHLERFWVDGREQLCQLPAAETGAGAANASAATPEGDRIRALEDRLSQLVQALDDLRNFHYRFMLTCGFIICLTVIGTAAYAIYRQISSRYEPPRLNSYAPVPVKIGNQTVLLGVGVVDWSVPPELNAILLQAEMLRREAAEKATNAVSETPASESSSNHASPPDRR